MENSQIIDNNDRRRILRFGLAGLCATVALPAWGAPIVPAVRRSLSFEHLHTGERASVEYWADGAYVPGALAEIDHVLRDFRTGEAISMDRTLYDLLHALRVRLDTDTPFQVISGYRSSRTNEALARKSRGVSRRSLHLFGKAIDVRIPGIPLKEYRKAALSLRMGGVGYYPRSNFLHVDTGRVRFW